MLVKDDYIVFDCVHCKEMIMVYKKEMNCQIFRHAQFKDTYKQVNPHLDQRLCEYLIKNDMVYGCCKPFKIVEENGQYTVEKCDYI